MLAPQRCPVGHHHAPFSSNGRRVHVYPRCANSSDGPLGRLGTGRPRQARCAAVDEGAQSSSAQGVPSTSSSRRQLLQLGAAVTLAAPLSWSTLGGAVTAQAAVSAPVSASVVQRIDLAPSLNISRV